MSLVKNFLLIVKLIFRIQPLAGGGTAHFPIMSLIDINPQLDHFLWSLHLQIDLSLSCPKTSFKLILHSPN